MFRNILRSGIKIHNNARYVNSNTVLPNKENKAEFVKQVFNNVAPKYDLMNDLMSAYVHRLWKCYFIHKMNPMVSTNLLDVAGGTGDIAFKFLETTRKRNDLKSQVTICDINEEMIAEGKKRALKLDANDQARLNWVVGDALDLPFEDESFDVYTIAYGIRNVPDIEKCLSEAHRVLRCGGMFMCLEFSQVSNPLMKSPYEKYLLEVLPIMGEVVVGDYKSYKYLAESILNFPDQEEFKEMIEASNFKCVSYENLLQGVSAIHTGFKPSI